MTDDRLFVLVVCALLAISGICNAIALIKAERRNRKFHAFISDLEEADRELDREYAQRRSGR